MAVKEEQAKSRISRDVLGQEARSRLSLIAAAIIAAVESAAAAAPSA